MDIDIGTIQWVYVTLIAPVLGWFGGWFHSWNGKRRKTKAVVAYLSGLPPEVKAELVNFHFHGAHTLRGDPTAPTVSLLVSQGLLSVGPGGGTYDAIDRYLTVRADVWEAMNPWIVTDHKVIGLMEEVLEKSQHDFPSGA